MDRLPEPAMGPTTARRTHGGNNAFHNFDPNLRRRLALSDIDKVPFGLYHIRAVVVAGVGFFLDSYDIFAINLILTFLGVVFWQGGPEAAANGFGGNHGVLPSSVNQTLKASTSAGIVVGQVLFGWLADVYGRRRMYGIELGIILLATLNCALANPSHAMSSTGVLVFWRVMMGIGIGGDYPLSSVITSEFAPTRWRGAMMAAVFSMQGIGQLLCAIVALVVTAAYRSAFEGITDVGACDGGCQVAADRCWRLIVGIGAVPACFALWYRITIPETPRYTFDVAHDVEKADADIKAYMASKSEGDIDSSDRSRKLAATLGPSLAIPSASWRDVYNYFRQWKNLKVLIGTTMSWFFLDLAFYGLGLNNTLVLHSIGYSKGPTLYHTLYNNAVGMIILACAGSLPGYWTSILTIDTFGRKPIQIMGFIVLTVLFCILGFAHTKLTEGSTLTLYIVAQFFFNFGPNTTTFIVPGECFPTRYRSTGHGISAAMGKVGAILAQVISIPLLAKDSPNVCNGNDCSPWLDRLMQIFALFMLLGTMVSLLIPETKGATLEELGGEEPSRGLGRGGAGDDGSSSVQGRSKGLRRWWRSPFSGGQPAGFFLAHQRAAAKRAGLRVGIMTSPELAAQQRAEHARKGFTWGSPGSPTNGASSPGAAGRAGARRGQEDGSDRKMRWGRRKAADQNRESDDYDILDGDPDRLATPPSVLPGWGAGWGRVERGDGRPIPMGGMRLQDVGSLLK